MGLFRFKIVLLPTLAEDTEKRELTLTVEGQEGEPILQTLPGNAVKSDWVGPYPVGTVIHASLVDVDDDGNRSVASAAFSHTVADTVAPGQPTIHGVTDVEEISDTPPAPVPPAPAPQV